MANEASEASWKGSGFGQTAGVKPLKTEANNISLDRDTLRQQAEAQYKPTYEAEKASLNNQLTELIKSQTDDSDLLNKQYQQSINTMMGKLSQRGLHVGSLPDTTAAALNKFRNEVMSQRQQMYDIQKQGVENVQQTLESNYDLNIEARINEIFQANLTSLTSLLQKISQLQTSSYNDYIQYLLAKKNQHRGGGGGGYRYRRRGYGSRSSSSSTATPNALSGNDFKVTPQRKLTKSSGRRTIVTRGGLRNGIKLRVD